MKSTSLSPKFYVNLPARIVNGWQSSPMKTALPRAHQEAGKTNLPVIHGFTHDGLAVFSSSKESYLLEGVLYRTRKFISQDGRRGRVFIPLCGKLSTLAKKGVQETRCIDATTGEELLFKGVPVTTPEKEALPPQPKNATEPVSVRTMETTATPMSATVSKGKAKSRKVSSRTVRQVPASVLRRIEELGTAYRAGLNPDLKIDDLCVLLQESRAKIYRKIGQKLFPPPIKRGRGSFWPMQVVVAYQEGKWQA